MKIKVYTKDSCPYCDMAKMLLTQKGIDFEQVHLGSDRDKIIALSEKTGMKTLPQIFIDDALIGGFDDLKSYDESGKLDEILSK